MWQWHVVTERDRERDLYTKYAHLTQKTMNGSDLKLKDDFKRKEEENIRNN